MDDELDGLSIQELAEYAIAESYSSDNAPDELDNSNTANPNAFLNDMNNSLSYFFNKESAKMNDWDIELKGYDVYISSCTKFMNDNKRLPNPKKPNYYK